MRYLSGPNWRLSLSLVVIALAYLGRPVKVRASFEESLSRANSYAVQYNDPASIQEGLERYNAVVDGFGDHPRVYEAKLAILNILLSEGSAQSITQADGLIRELADEADLTTSEGQGIALRFVYFHIFHAQGKSFQDLDKAEAMLKRLAAQTGGDKKSLLRLRIAHRSAEIDIVRKNEVEALKASLNMLDEAMGWAKSGFWKELYKKDLSAYKEYVRELSNIASAGAWAIDRSKDPQVSELLRDKPLLLMSFEALRDALKQFETRLYVGDLKKLKRIEEDTIESTLEDMLFRDVPQGESEPNKNSDVALKIDVKSSPKTDPCVVGTRLAPTGERSHWGRTVAWLLGGIVAAVFAVFVWRRACLK